MVGSYYDLHLYIVPSNVGKRFIKSLYHTELPTKVEIEERRETLPIPYQCSMIKYFSKGLTLFLQKLLWKSLKNNNKINFYMF